MKPPKIKQTKEGVKELLLDQYSRSTPFAIDELEKAYNKAGNENDFKKIVSLALWKGWGLFHALDVIEEINKNLDK